MDFKPIKNSKVYEKVIEQIKYLIYSGKLKKGDKLPSERKLKEQLNVSRASIREAFSALEMIGLIESRPGEGTYIKDTQNNNFLEPLSMILLLEENASKELIELRKVLEVNCVKLASKRATKDDLAEIKKHNINLSNSSGFEEESIQEDRLFHYTIARASKNNVLSHVMISISEAMDFHIKNTRTHLVSKKETMVNFVQQHWEIYNNLKDGNTEEAMNAMKKHLDYVESLINREIKP